MPPIRRAAVTGLFALWLAPLGAMAESRSSPCREACCGERCSHAEAYAAEDRQGAPTEEAGREVRRDDPRAEPHTRQRGAGPRL